MLSLTFWLRPPVIKLVLRKLLVLQDLCSVIQLTLVLRKLLLLQDLCLVIQHSLVLRKLLVLQDLCSITQLTLVLRKLLVLKTCVQVLHCGWVQCADLQQVSAVDACRAVQVYRTGYQIRCTVQLFRDHQVDNQTVSIQRRLITFDQNLFDILNPLSFKV